MLLSMFSLLWSSLLETVFSQTCQCASPSSSNYNAIQPNAYNEPLRPQIHFSPSSQFMNDPNGLFYSNGTYHLYGQYNPSAPVAGFQHWLHATSKDAIHWENQPIAIAPKNESYGIFSGSCVVDANNTSGFFNASVPVESRVIAMYTLYSNITGSQTQEIAYSSDEGYTFTKFSGNPVIDVGQDQFRDPKVFWHAETSQWIVVLVFASRYQVAFYSSPDLKTWTELSRFGPHGILGYQYEVPDLIRLPIEGTDEFKWVLFVSINPGAPQGGSFMQYFMGDFNGTHFNPDDNTVSILDFGKDFYAGINYANLPADQGVLMQAWASNWQYTQNTPTLQDGGLWRNSQSLVRRLTVRKVAPNPQVERYTVIVTPVGLDKLNPSGIYKGSTSSDRTNSTRVTVPLTSDGAFEFNITAQSSTYDAGNATLLIDIHSNDIFQRESISIGYSNSQLWIDRGNAQRNWYNPFFTDKLSVYSQPLDLSRPGVLLRGVIDRSILELFVNDGTHSAVVTFFMSAGRRPGSMSVTVSSGMSLNASVASLESIWCRCPQKDEL